MPRWCSLGTAVKPEGRSHDWHRRRGMRRLPMLKMASNRQAIRAASGRSKPGG